MKTLTFAALLAVASLALAEKRPKVDVCHRSVEIVPDEVTGEPVEVVTFHTINVNGNALDAHLAHGDSVGACPVVPPVDPPVIDQQ